jgi:hypothetical protein
MGTKLSKPGLGPGQFDATRNIPSRSDARSHSANSTSSARISRQSDSYSHNTALTSGSSRYRQSDALIESASVSATQSEAPSRFDARSQSTNSTFRSGSLRPFDSYSESDVRSNVTISTRATADVSSINSPVQQSSIREPHSAVSSSASPTPQTFPRVESTQSVEDPEEDPPLSQSIASISRLLRDMYSLDFKIFGSEGPRSEGSRERMEMINQANLIFARIMRTLLYWEENRELWSIEQYEVIRSIRITAQLHDPRRHRR